TAEIDVGNERPSYAGLSCVSAAERVVVRVAIPAFHFEAFGKRQAIEKGHDELAVEFRHLQRGIDFRMLRYAARVRQLARDRQRVFPGGELLLPDRKSTRLNSSHVKI